LIISVDTGKGDAKGLTEFEPQTGAEVKDNSPYVSASPIPKPESKDVPRTLTTDEIKEYIAAYATASKNAIRALSCIHELKINNAKRA